VAAFNTVPSEVLFDVTRQAKAARPSLVYCGDDRRAKTAARLIRDVGLSPGRGPL
jgi:predicted dinucleotide-binding enzyme